MGKAVIDKDYAKWILQLKTKVQQAQLKAAAMNNQVLIEVYWELGKSITERQKKFGYGDGFIDKVATDLKVAFPDIKGFSRRNLYAIRQWYLFYSEKGGIVHQVGAQLPWRHQVLLVQKFKDLKIINLYAKSVIRFGWSGMRWKRILRTIITSGSVRRIIILTQRFLNLSPTWPSKPSRILTTLIF